MVRLKDKSGCVVKSTPLIISIPYGAIKSVKPKTIRIKVSLFQFLMVRLKAINDR